MNRIIAGLAMAAALVAASVLAPLVAADGMIIVRPTPDQLRQGVRNYPLSVKYHRVKTSVSDQQATTAIDQVFHNPTDFRLEGTYIFPVPAGAAISQFSMDIDGQPMKGEVLDREKAREIYENIVRQSLDPALLEYVGSEVVQLRIFPIEPRSDKRIQISYTEVITAERGVVSYRYPLNTEKFSSKPLDEVSVEVRIADAAGVGAVHSSSHKIAVDRKGPGEVVAKYEATGVTPDRDFVVSYLKSQGAVGISLASFARPGEDGYFSMLISPNIEVKPEDAMPKDVVFVFDTSGSMLEGDKIGQARKALAYCLGRLTERDRFALIDFSTEVRSYKPDLVAVDADSRKGALAYVEALEATGGTYIDGALETALGLLRQAQAGRPFIVVFMTDGTPTIGERDGQKILANAAKISKDTPCRLFSFGVGSNVNTHLLDELASTRRGTSVYVDATEDLEIKVSALFDKIAYPVLTDMTIAVEGMVVKEMFPKPLPDLFRGGQIVLVGRYQGDGARAITLEGTWKGERRKIVYEASFAAGKTDQDHLPHLWAKRKVGHLLDSIRIHGENAEIKAEVIALSKRYGIITPYTAYLVTEDQAKQSVPPAAGWDGAPGRAFGGAAPAEERERAQKGLNAESGADAVDASRQAEALRVVEHADGDDKGDAAGERVVRRVGDKTFYKDGARWVDSAYDGAKMAAGLEKIEYLSDRYFALLKAEAGIGKFLALGTALVVVKADGTAVEIVAGK